MANSLNKPKAPKPFAGSKPVKRAALAKATKAPMVKSTAKPKATTPMSRSTAKPKAKSVTPAHLKELKTEAKRVKGLYDPTARPGFQFGKGTM